MTHCNNFGRHSLQCECVEYAAPEGGSAMPSAVLDETHVGDIQGALGTLKAGDTAPRETWRHRWATFLAILGPGLILERFGKFWGAYSVVDLFILNALTIVTEFQ